MAYMDAGKVVRGVVIIIVFLVSMMLYWKLVIPGYFKGITLCSEGCHETRVLAPENITHPFWCVGCHGFGVKSEILPGIPLYRDHELELMVEEHGECLMCHRLPGDFHAKHIEAKPEDLRRLGLERPVQCTDCHVDAYHGHHTEKPRDKVCVKCHDAYKLHPNMVKSVRAACTACHSEKPVIAYEELKPNATTYSTVLFDANKLVKALGMREAVRGFECLVCHVEPFNPGHLSHVNKTVRETGELVTCTRCHKSELMHGARPGVELCVDCHKPNATWMHERDEPLRDCFRCHRGFRMPNVSLVPARGCVGCHGDTYYLAVMVGLHKPHVEAYRFNCSVCHNATLATHKEFIESASSVDLCKACHTREGGLKPEAVRGLVLKYGLFTGVGLEHATLVSRADGDCFKCHYEWFVVSKPEVVYAYGGGGG